MKPKKQTIKYYDWFQVEKYMIENKIWTELFASDFWIYLTGDRGIQKGKKFVITDWELKSNGGEFEHMIPKKWRASIIDLMKHFGEPDKGCLDPGILTATFIASW